MSRITLHSGVWSSGGLGALGGAGVMAQYATQPLPYDFGLAAFGFSVSLIAWGVKYDDEHWWHKDRIRMAWPYALMVVGIAIFFVGLFFAWMPLAPRSHQEAMIPLSLAKAESRADVQHYAAQHDNLEIPHSLHTTESGAVNKPNFVYVPLAKGHSSIAATFHVPDQTNYRNFFRDKLQGFASQLMMVTTDSASSRNEQELSPSENWFYQIFDPATGGWIEKNMGEYAFEHYRSLPTAGFSSQAPWNGAPAERARRERLITMMKARQSALESMINTADWDPSDPKHVEIEP